MIWSRKKASHNLRCYHHIRGKTSTTNRVTKLGWIFLFQPFIQLSIWKYKLKFLVSNIYRNWGFGSIWRCFWTLFALYSYFRSSLVRWWPWTMLGDFDGILVGFFGPGKLGSWIRETRTGTPKMASKATRNKTFSWFPGLKLWFLSCIPFAYVWSFWDSIMSHRYLVATKLGILE